MFEWVLWGGFGLIIGSFVNVLIVRHGTRSILGRSSCPHCGTTLEWYELVPVLSWVFLLGRCRTCKKRISLQYPLVELLTMAGFLAVGLSPAALAVKVIGAAIIALLVAIAVYDLYHTIIPDVWAFSFAGLALLESALAAPDVPSFLLHGIAGPLVALPLFLLWLVSKGAWMGLGDAKFALGMGFLLGILEGFVALGFAFVIGACVGVCILLPLPRIVKLLQRAGITRASGARGFTMKSEVPFGPFLICALLFVWFSELYGIGLIPRLADLLSWS